MITKTCWKFEFEILLGDGWKTSWWSEGMKLVLRNYFFSASLVWVIPLLGLFMRNIVLLFGLPFHIQRCLALSLAASSLLTLLICIPDPSHQMIHQVFIFRPNIHTLKWMIRRARMFCVLFAYILRTSTETQHSWIQ